MAKLQDKTRIYGSANVDNSLFVLGTQNASSPYSGSLQISGGVGIYKDLWVGGDINAVQNVNTTGIVLTGDIYKNGVLYNNYVLPTADSSTLGGVKIGTGFTIGTGGVINVAGYNSISNNTITVLGGLPSIPLFKPSSTDFPLWINQGSSTITDGVTGAIFKFPNDGGNSSVRAATRPFGSHTVWEVCFDPSNGPGSDNSSVGLFMYESYTGKGFSFEYMNYNGFTLMWRDWRGSVAYASGQIEQNFPFQPWVRIRIDSSNLYCETSYTGEEGTYVTQYSAPLANKFTASPNYVGICGNHSSYQQSAVVLSALSHPGTRPSVTTGIPGVVSWVNFNGNTGSIGNPVTTRDFYNVDSVVKQAPGDYIINFGTNLSNDSYAVTITSDDTTNTFSIYDSTRGGTDPTVSQVRIKSSGNFDPTRVMVVVSSNEAVLGSFPGAANTGVTQIIAGNNIIISPSVGTGVVTINTSTPPIVPASNIAIGIVQIGTGIDFNANGVISIDPGVKSIIAGSGVTVTPANGKGNVTVTSSYTLPVATTSTLGGVKVDGTTITISGGVISAVGGGGGGGTANNGVMQIIAGSGISVSPANGVGNVTVSSTVSPYTLPAATMSSLGGIIIGSGLSVAANGYVSTNTAGYSLPAATTSALGGVIVGSNLNVAANGYIWANPPYTLPIATTDTLGGVKVDNNTITINAAGYLIGTPAYSLPVASNVTLGGIKTDGTTVQVVDGILSTTFTLPPTIVTSVVAGTGISVSTVDGVVTITNTGGSGGGTVGTFPPDCIPFANQTGDLSNSDSNLKFANSTLYSANILAQNSLHLGYSNTMSAFYMTFVPTANAVDFIFG